MEQVSIIERGFAINFQIKQKIHENKSMEMVFLRCDKIMG